MGRFKQLLLREVRRCKTREKQLRAALGQGPVSLLMDTYTTISLRYSADKEIPSRWEKQLINDGQWPVSM